MTNLIVLSIVLVTNQQGTVNQKINFGYVERGKPVSVGESVKVIKAGTNAAFLNTNSPAYKRRLEREQRMRGTNTPPVK